MVVEAAKDKLKLDFTKAHTVYRDKNGKRLPGVTTVLGIIDKPALVGWANRMGLEGFDTSRLVKDAADKGTLAHAMAQAHVMGMELDWDSINCSKSVRNEAENAFIKFLGWWGDGRYTRIASEFVMISEKWGCGGTGDIFAIRNADGKLLYVDLKTSNGVYREMKIQVSAYAEMYDEVTGNYVDEVWIVRIGKEDTGDFEAVQVFNRSECVTAFEAALPLYRALQKVK